MTKDEIIKMARQAGMMTRVLYLGRNLELLTNFAKLVAEHERAQFVFAPQIGLAVAGQNFVEQADVVGDGLRHF